MSAADDRPLDVQEQIVRITRMVQETQKFIAAHDKLAAEAKKFNRERLTGIVAAVAALLAAAAAVVNLLHTYGKI